MLSIGYQIRQANDPLHTISLANLAEKIQHPDQRFIDFINQMRSVMVLDTKRYREMKTRLPYVVAASFNPPYRRIEHFGSTSFFIIDLDHLADKEMDKNQLFSRICQDPRTALCFTSPSGDGLKVIFQLASPFRDAGKYSVFYKSFATKYAQQLGVAQVIDKVTSDVSRACFVSYDPDLYFNEQPTPVDSSSFVDFENEWSLHEMLQQENEMPSTPNQAATQPHSTTSTRQDLPDDILQKIKERLSPILKAKAEKVIFVPEELDNILPLITAQLTEAELQLDSIKNIHYGKQLKVSHLQWWGEINVFYGKKGYSVVKSTKSGSSEKITDIAAAIVMQTLQP